MLTIKIFITPPRDFSLDPCNSEKCNFSHQTANCELYNLVGLLKTHNAIYGLILFYFTNAAKFKVDVKLQRNVGVDRKIPTLQYFFNICKAIILTYSRASLQMISGNFNFMYSAKHYLYIYSL